MSGKPGAKQMRSSFKTVSFKGVPLKSNPYIVIAILLLLNAYLALRRPETPLPPSLPSSPSQRLFYANQHRETCDQWIGAQRAAHSYLDAYIIGTQKGGTSELTKRLHALGVRRDSMSIWKEWHYFNTLDANGLKSQFNSQSDPFRASNIHELKMNHLRSGWKGSYSGTMGDPNQLDLVDDNGVQNRSIVYDGCVEYSHSDRSAFLAHLLTPHARAVMLIREPIGRAVSQYNMMVRHINKDNGENRRPNAAEFDLLVTTEMEVLKQCGYVSETGYSPVSTAEMIACVHLKIEKPSLLVFRGLYHLHVSSWLQYFPSHRMMFLRFNDMLKVDEEALNGLTRFLCVRQFPRDMLEGFREKSSSGISFGKQVKMYGKTNGTDDLSGADWYFDEVLPETRKRLQSFYSGSARMLTEMMGTEMYQMEMF